MSFYRPKIVPKDDDEDSLPQSYTTQQAPQPPMTPTTYYQAIMNKDSEIAELRSQVNNLQEKVRSQEQQLANQNIKIQQQAETIQIHSREMSKPQVDKTATTPFRAYSHYGNTNPNLMKEPPPVFNPMSQPFQPAKPNAIQTKWGPITDSQKPAQQLPINPPSSNTHVNKPPKNGNDWREVFPEVYNKMVKLAFEDSPTGTPPPTMQPPTGMRNMTSTPVPVPSINSGPSQAPRIASQPFTPEAAAVPSSTFFTGVNTGVNPVSTGVNPANAYQNQNIAAEWKKLFDLTITFAYNHVNVPSNQWDSRLPPQLKEKLMSAATKTTAARLLSTQSTRYFLVTRIILEWFNRFVFTNDSLKGLDQGIDRAIDLARNQLNQNPPEAIRYVFVQDIRKQFAALTQNPGFENHIRTISNQRANQLWQFIQPLKFVPTQNDQSDLLVVMIAAHKLAAAQFCDAAEYRIFFYDANQSFNDAAMVNMDNEYGSMSSEEVVARQGVVKVTVAPQVMTRLVAPNGTGTTEILVKAGVLLKFRDYMVKDLKKET